MAIQYTSPRHISVTDTAKLVRAELKKNFAGTKFSVRSRSYSGGASIDIEWTDGATSKAVDKTVQQFKGATFDGMQDLKEYHDSILNGEVVHFGADFIFTQRKRSVPFMTAIAKAYCDRYGYQMPEILVSCGDGYIDRCNPYSDEINRLASDCSGDEIEGLQLCIFNGTLSIKHTDTVEDVACDLCGFYRRPEQYQYINDKHVCQYCIEKDTATLSPEDIELPLPQEAVQTPEQETLSAKVIDIQTRKPVQPTLQVQTTRQLQVQKGTPVKTEVLDVLKQGHTEGNLYYLPNVRLERKLYQDVNEVLERIGGKWNRKAKAHIFEDTDPAQLLELVLDSGEMPSKNPTAFFATPVSVIDYMLNDGAFPRIPEDAQRILEPSAGKGNIAHAIRQYCQVNKIKARIHCCEILPRFQQHLIADGFDVACSDFLDYNPPWQYDAIIMNPPFAVEGDPLAYITHIEHAWLLLAPGGILLAVAPSGFAFRNDKRVQQLRELVEVHGTWRELKDGAFKASGTGVNTVILSMTKK